MSKELDSTISLAKELRLRSWARTHYVSADQRKETWNPVVLEEMKIKDQEMSESEENSMNVRVSSMFVPLAPAVNRRLDEAHVEVSAPHILKMQDVAARRREHLVEDLMAE
ncbi:hypothetical protein [Gimesia algae]|uniref:Uncharacterized protein n=1 Tax=Gimesia algae TaxID=2527971 RepID=A0A517VMT2_9PLAN|nr:hypothetical protein [Gimesia algae]QDT94220.1 hypothetical protein Pan161_59140 [Gimesia algae]